MNNDVFEGSWKQIRGRLKEYWGRLTDDEIDQVEGRYDRMAGLLQEKYGYSRQAAEDEIRSFLDQVESDISRSTRP
jgi:uncharacterized protein YjbJ (UPF0337 family)